MKTEDVLITGSLGTRLAGILCRLKSIHAVNSPAEKAGITPALASTLIWIAEHDGTSISRIASGCGTTRPTATAAVDRLERNALVVRTQSTTDRRGIHVNLTRQGRSLARSINRYRISNMERLLENLTEREQETLVTLLEKAVAEVTS